MIKTMHILTIVALCCLWNTSLLAQSNSSAKFWQDVEEHVFVTKNTERQIIPNAYRTLRIDWTVMNPVLEAAPMRFSAEAATPSTFINLPMPDGSTEQFKIVEAPVLHEDLAKKYPGIHSYAGQGIDDPTAYLRFDVTPKGFHAMVLSGKHSGVFIDPYAKGDTDHYISYYKKDFFKASNFVCHVEDVVDENNIQDLAHTANRNPLTGDCQLRTYRLALSCTGEYAQFHGGTVDDVMAAMTTTMTRVNGIYEKDATITMVLIPNNDELIFLSSSSDPFTNSSGGAMLGQNQTTIDNIIGSPNYDIGHVFSTGGGGVAQLNSPCNSARKAQGVTGQPAPVGDPFDVDYVAHEMGHQYGGNHTQNNSCNNVSGISVEPGSASTIMGYAGICTPNVQTNSDAYFHIINLREIANNVVNGSGGNCPVTTETGNNPPTAEAGENYTIPASTPFALTGVATDEDGLEALTYNWEQMDAQSAAMPPRATNSRGPAFRSITPVSSPTRYFPNLQAVIDNDTPTWEVLSSVSRTMDFTFSVRDNHIGGGCVADDDMTVTVSADAGPFLVQSPNTNVTWHVEEFQTIEWDVANTDAAPISCAEVNVLLSTDGGLTYPVTIAENVPNTGSLSIIVPDHVGDSNRIKVICSDNVFYDISNTNFEILPPLEPGFSMIVAPASQSICASELSTTFQLNVNSILDFAEEITFSTENLPEGLEATFSPAQITPSGETMLTISNLDAATPGTYAITIQADTDTIQQSQDITLQILSGSPAVATLMSPETGISGIDPFPILTWSILEEAFEYTVEVATTPTFDNIVASASLTQNNFNPEGLEEATVYYWRVKSNNICGESDYSNTFSFQTRVKNCMVFESTDVPITISTTPGTITSNLNIPDNLTISDFNISQLNIQHSWVGDLSVNLTSPDATEIALIDRPGRLGSGVGCSSANIQVSFDDDAAATAEDLENTCGTNPAIGGAFQAIDPLSALNGLNAQGDWLLTITDHAAQDGGQLNNWALEVCIPVPVTTMIDQQVLVVETGSMGIVSSDVLQVTSQGNEASDIVFTITGLPSQGTLMFNNLPVMIGTTFTQADIDNNLLLYIQDGEIAEEDTFLYDVLDADNGWLANNVFDIIIFSDGFIAVASETNGISCHDSNDGSLSVDVFGGAAPFQYSLDGENFQDSPIFENLVPETYSVVVMDSEGMIHITDPLTFAAPEELIASSTVDDNTITIEASGGTGELQYSIDDGSTFVSENTFSFLENGTYDIVVMDGNACQVSFSETVNIIFAFSFIVTPLSCSNAMDGDIIITSIIGGTPPYQYSLNDGEFQSDSLFTDLGADNYVVTVRDVNDNILIIDVPLEGPPAIELSTDVMDANLTIIASGGTAPLQYSIDGGVTFGNESSFSDLENGMYDIVVMDANGCQVTDSAIINVSSLKDLKIDLFFDVQPNPNQGVFNMILNQVTEKNLTIQIVDALGRIVFEEQATKTTLEFQQAIDINHLADGIYFLKITDGVLLGTKQVSIVR